jgi:homospermidine synthase
VQRPYLGPVEAHYTDWTPLAERADPFAAPADPADPWQFRNVLAD